MTTAEIVGTCWLTAEVAIGAVCVAVLLLRRQRAGREAEAQRLEAGIKAIRALPVAPELATVHIAPSPLVPTRRLAARRDGHQARLDQQARHAAVVAATAGPFTREFNARVEWETGQPPKGRGPAEADLPARRVRRRPVAEWAQDELPIEIGA